MAELKLKKRYFLTLAQKAREEKKEAEAIHFELLAQKYDELIFS